MNKMQISNEHIKNDDGTNGVRRLADEDPFSPPITALIPLIEALARHAAYEFAQAQDGACTILAALTMFAVAASILVVSTLIMF